MLSRCTDDGDPPSLINRAESQIRPIALGRNNGWFAGSLRAGNWVAAVMSCCNRRGSRAGIRARTGAVGAMGAMCAMSASV
jgi:hypothetical protein